LIIAGLTGGIASGKSTVAAIFKGAGAVIIDADVIARQVVAPGQPAWQAIGERFGRAVLHADETIDRERLGELVFNEEPLRRQLEQIIHPHVRRTIDSEIQRLRKARPQAVVVQDIPLLYETGMTRGMAEIIVVYAPRALQLKRLLERDRIGTQKAWARINAQMPIEEKCRRATIVINNSGPPAATHAQALKVYADLEERARSHTESGSARIAGLGLRCLTSANRCT
jgi:dephospho-CoA kinase